MSAGEDSAETFEARLGFDSIPDDLPYVERLKRSYGGDVTLILATDKTLRKAWYFVLPESRKRDHLLGLGAKDSCNLEDFGEIVLSGYGERPPGWAYERIEREWGTKFD